MSLTRKCCLAATSKADRGPRNRRKPVCASHRTFSDFRSGRLPRHAEVPAQLYLARSVAWQLLSPGEGQVDFAPAPELPRAGEQAEGRFWRRLMPHLRAVPRRALSPAFDSAWLHARRGLARNQRPGEGVDNLVKTPFRSLDPARQIPAVRFRADDRLKKL